LALLGMFQVCDDDKAIVVRRCKKPTNYRELDEVEYRALALTAVLIILYFIGFLIHPLLLISAHISINEGHAVVTER
jgi:preprotein translocase subunit Sss1